ncbi:UNVERIFIED_CONTAM: hypothetical protein FKN15_046070 [Acipenser sinensis]
MFPIHYRLAASNSSSTSMPVSVACEGFNYRTFRCTQTMRYAIDEINKREDILPNTELEYVIYDSCFTISKSVEGTLTYLTGQDEAVPNYRCSSGAPLAALLGTGGSVLSIATARILGLYYFSQVSYGSSCTVLSDKFQFPSFLRTIPNDDFQSKAMANLVVYFGWTWVGTIAADDDYGKYGIKLFKEEVEKAGVCISFSETLPKLYSRETILNIVETVKRSTANIIVVFATDVDLSPLIEKLIIHNITDKTWIASEAWVTSALISKPEYYSALGGTLGFAIRRAHIPNLKEYLLNINPFESPDPLIGEFWQRAFNCTLEDMHAVENMYTATRNPDGTISYVEIGQYNSTAPPGSEMTINNGSIVWINDKVEAPCSVCSESCQPGTRKGIRQGEPVCCFDFITCADREISNEADSRECIQCGEDYWSNTKRDACVAKDIEFLAYDEALGITLLAVSAFGACIAIAVTIIFLVYRNTALVKANDAVLSFFIQFSLVITFLSSIIVMGEPVKWSCMTRQVSLALGFCVCLSCIMGKTIVLMFTARAAKSKNPEKTNSELIRPIHQRIIALTCILIHACACAVWLVLYPPYPVKNTASQNIKILLECDEGSIIFICCIFGYDVLLALLGFVFAFMACKLPDNFNEAKFVTFGMLVFFIVWISFVPAYLSTRGKFMVAVEIFAILASSFGLLACIFIPKCYIILLKPERNTDALVRCKPKMNDTSAPDTSASITSELNSTTVSTVSLDE